MDVKQREITAEELSKDFKEISIAEFFEKNRHLLGYENPTKSLITIVKELVDNSLDACEEANILPNINVKVQQITEEKFKILVEDNGPGIVPEKVPLAFGKLLYGTKFHKLKQTRGTQGLGAHGAILYSQLTTGKPAKITTTTEKEIHKFELMIDVMKNEPNIISHEKEKNIEKWHGLKLEVECVGRYIEGKQSIPEYLKQTAILHPYAKIVYNGPNGKSTFERVTEQMPQKPKEIKPHPYGMQLGILRRFATTTKAKNMIGFLTKEFSRLGKRSAQEMCKLAKIPYKTKPKDLQHDEIERLHKAMQMVKLMSPPTNVLSPLGENLITEGLEKEVEAEHFVAISRPPTVYSGFPFVVEIGLAYGGKLPLDQSAQLMRFANKVPLIYHSKDCVTSEACIETDWRRYGFSQSSGQLPLGPLIILVHFASVWVPYTSEGKQAISAYPEIMKEVKLALQEAGRQLSIYIRRKQKSRESQLRKELFENYIAELAEDLSKLSNEDKEKIAKGLREIIKKGESSVTRKDTETSDEKS